MDDNAVLKAADAFIEVEWERILTDIEALLGIASVEDLDRAAPGMPYGPATRRALDCALGMASSYGLATGDVDGYAGYADLPGASSRQLGIIGHVDVVPSGEGWHFPPFALTKADGYLIGRGVIDDKAPMVIALHAVRFWMGRCADGPLPFSIRLIFGCGEETGMGDVARYRARFADPAFLFTPDADFPVGYGEKGTMKGRFTSAERQGGIILDLTAGEAVNAVPGSARASVSLPPSAFPAAEGVTIEESPKGSIIVAAGIGGHASLPEGTRNAIAVLARYLQKTGRCSESENRWLDLVSKVTGSSDGSAVGISSSDGDFGALTAAGGVLRTEGPCFTQTIDVRYPTSIDAGSLCVVLGRVAASAGASFAMIEDEPPFLMDPASAPVQALLGAYRAATGRDDARPFTMGGGTYARHFPVGVSFGPHDPSVDHPSWVGGMHGPDEGIGEDELKRALRIYILTIGRLMEMGI